MLQLDDREGPSTAASVSASLVCDLITNFEACPISREAWDDAVIRFDGGIYSSYDWTRTWWEFYGAGKKLRLLIFSVDGEIAGIIPAYIDSVGISPLNLRVARLIGSNIPPKAFRFAVDRSWAAAVFEKTLIQFLGNDRCDVVSFGPISELSEVRGCFEKACEARRDFVGSISRLDGVHSVFWIPKTMDDYYGLLSQNEKKNRRKYELRSLRRDHDVRVDVVSEPSQLMETFDQFAKQHAEQWRFEGKTGHFGAWPAALEYNRALVRAQGSLGRARFIRILVDGRVIANQYTFAFGNAYYWELPSRDVDPRWSSASLGPTGIVNMIQRAMEEGIRVIEGGLSHYDYKLRLGATEYRVRTIRACSVSIQSRIRVRGFLVFRKIIEILYHKLWYRRVCPRLPLKFSRPQWPFWLRLDF